MHETKLSVLNGSGEKLVGIETIPSARKDKYPAVILVHGFDVTKEERGMFDALAQKLSDAGFLVYRFDFSGCGESGGDYSETSLSKLRSDLSKIMDFVRSQPKADDSRTGVLGQSFGTSVTIALEPKVKCLIMLGSVSHPKEILSRIFGGDYNPGGISAATRSDGRITRVKSGFWKDLEDHDLPESIKNIHCPILFIHGSEDSRVPVSEMEDYFRNANEPKEKVILEGAGHGMIPCREEMHRIAIGWFRRWLV